jgi:flagellar protein FliS
MTMHARKIIAYKKTFVDSASPARLLDELYTRLLADLDDIGAALEARDVKRRGEALHHAMRIVEELALALDHDRAPELAENLERLYEFVTHALTQTHLSQKPEPLASARRVVVELREAYRQVTGLFS